MSPTGKQLSDKISAHRRQLDQRRLDEERRLLYVAITRAEDTLLVSGYHWGAAESKARGPSDFLGELKDAIDASEAAGAPCGVVEHWAPAPADGERNPLRDTTRSKRSGRSIRWAPGAMTSSGGPRWSPRRCPLTRRPRQRLLTPKAGWPTSMRCWPNTNALPSRHRPTPALPGQLSVSGLVELARDPDGAAQRLAAPVAGPAGPACTAGHRVPRLGAAVLRRRAAVRPRGSARCGGQRQRRSRSEQLAVLQAAFAGRRGRPGRRRGRGALRDGHRRHGGAGPHRRGVRRRRRRSHRRGLEDR